MSEQAVSVGRIVHWRYSERGPCQAAIVAKVLDTDAGSVNLAIVGDLGSVGSQVGVSQTDDGSGRGAWHWPERV